MTVSKAKPTRKVAAGTASGAVATVVVWLLSLAGVEVPAPVGAAVAWLAAAGLAYLVREHREV